MREGTSTIQRAFAGASVRLQRYYNKLQAFLMIVRTPNISVLCTMSGVFSQERQRSEQTGSRF